MAKKTEKPKEEEVKKNADDGIPEADVNSAAYVLEQTVMDLIAEEPFYANLTLNMRRNFTTKFPTLAVNVTDEVNLWINPYFFLSLTESERVDVLKHECLHVINNHFVRFHDLEPQIFDPEKMRDPYERAASQKSASVLNQAADYAINEFLPKLPKIVNVFDPKGKKIVEPDVIADAQGQPIKNPNAGKVLEGKILFVNDLKKKIPHIQNQQNLEYYYEFLKLQEEKDNKNGKGKGQGSQGPGTPGSGQGDPNGGMTLDDHTAWHETNATEDQITEKVKEVVNKAVEQTEDKSRGSIPGNVLEAINRLNHVPKDWRQDIQRFVARTSETLIESSRKIRNRRYGITAPGYRKVPKLHIAIGVDTSGSVGTEELQQFFAELERLHNMEIKLTVIECDTQVNAVYDFDPKKEVKVHGRGGTYFTPVFEKCNELDVDGLIYFTDGGGWGDDWSKVLNKAGKPFYPVLWALTPPFSLSLGNIQPFGSQTKIEIKKRVAR